MGPISTPPLPPDVVSQQTPPSLRFMEQAGAASQQSLQKVNSLEFVAEKMNQVSALLGEVANVLVLEKPSLIATLKIMAQAGSSILNEVSKSTGAPPSGDGSPQAQMPQPEDAAGAVSMS